MSERVTSASTLAKMTLFLFTSGCSLVSDTVSCGRFPLKVIIETPSPEQSFDIKYAVCWNSAFAEYAMEYGDSVEMEFHPLENASEKGSVVYVPFSNRTGPFGGERSYSQAKFLVIEHSTTIDGDVVRKRQQLGIPDGRRKRDITLSLKAVDG